MTSGPPLLARPRSTRAVARPVSLLCVIALFQCGAARADSDTVQKEEE
ncbi:hypothetical protein [Streptomyces sp. NRRL F-5135]|nr:hypothetical protein [Streptomyces sp. NRRL F-5135]